MPSFPSHHHLSSGQRALLREKVHLAPGCMTRAPGHLSERLSSGWEGAVLLVEQLAGLPETALHWWAGRPRGHVVLTARADSYICGTLSVGRQTLAAVAQVPLSLLADDPAGVAVLALQPLDHLLGCAGADEGSWLSQGSGIAPRWQRVGGQIAALFALGYALSHQGRANPHIYLAEGAITALRDRRRLNVADPKLERLLCSTLLNDGFWRNWLSG